MPEGTLVQRLRRRKLVQWALAYLAGAWVVYEVTATVGSSWGLSDALLQGLFIALSIGFLITLVLAWYHGEKGRQRVSGAELIMITVLLVIAGGVLSLLGREPVALEPEGSGNEEVGGVAGILNQQPGIAVLPFENRSGLPDDQYFTDGIQDELLTRLSRVPGLRVPARTSIEAYRDIEQRVIREIGQALSVNYVLEGSVQRAGDQVRIIAQLIDVETEDHIWSDIYDRVLTTENLFEIQSEIVHTVAGELNIALRAEERLRAALRSTKDLEAHDLLFRATSFWSEGQLEEALSLAQEAVARDPRFVGAQTFLARGHAYLYHYGGYRSADRKEVARAAAERAVALAPESEDAQLAMGIYLYRVEKDYQRALEWLSRASGSLSGDFQYHLYRALTERRMGLWNASVASFEAALTLSPLSSGVWLDASLNHLCLRRYEDAESALMEVERLDPGARRGRFYHALLTWFRDGDTGGFRALAEVNPNDYNLWEVAMSEGRFEEARAILDSRPEEVVHQYFWYPKRLLVAQTLEALGEREAARSEYQAAAAVLERLANESPEDERYRASLAWAYGGLGRHDAAVQEAERAVEIMPRERDAMGGPFFLFNLAATYARAGRTDEAISVLEDVLSLPSRFAPNMLEDHFRLRPIQGDPKFIALMDQERKRVF